MSRAREKLVPAALQRLGAPNPRPLRSNDYPDGLPDLEGLDLIKVKLANKLSDFVAEVVLDMHQRRAFFTVENPLNSYLWARPSYASLARLPGIRIIRFQACMHGGRRPKRQAFMTNQAAMRQARKLRCAGTLPTKPTRRRATQAGRAHSRAL